jgi:transposase
MELMHESCCGLDVHKRVVVGCLITPGKAGQPQREVRSFSTMTRGLLELSDWLQNAGCTHVAMESTGSFWKPIYNLLEGTFKLLLVNAQHLKAVPGRKTDVKDAEWIADLLRHGLLRPSFIPSRPDRELRELTRYRTALVQERAAEVNRVQKVLEGANIKLASVASNVLGVSGRAMLEALVAGHEDPRELADFARGRLREKRAALEEALVGRLGAHQRFLLKVQLQHIDQLDATIEALGQEIDIRLRPFKEAAERLMTIPGVGERGAQVLLAEIGADMSRFPTAGHLASWAAVCPGNHESAGKQTSGRTRKGSPWLKAILVEAAQAASRTKTYLGAQYRRLAARRGARRAAMAVAHTILLIAYRLLKDGGTYRDLGVDYFDQRDRERVEKRLVRRLEGLGYNVTLAPATA